MIFSVYILFQVIGLLKVKSFVCSYAESLESMTNKERRENVAIQNLTETEWKKVEEICEVLESPFILTKQLQTSTYTLSDFYGAWLRMEIAVRKHISNRTPSDEVDSLDLAEKLLESLEFYRGQLLANPMLLAAVYLDPRFTKFVKVPAKTLAIAKLVNVWEQINDKESNVEYGDDDAELERYLAEGTIETSSGNENIHDLLVNFTKLPAEKPTYSNTGKTTRTRCLSYINYHKLFIALHRHKHRLNDQIQL